MLRYRTRAVSAAGLRRAACLMAALTCWTVGLASVPGRAADVRQVYLIQNSGWMEPFLLDPKSPFRDLVTAFVGATQLEGIGITVASFNQNGQVANQTSPHKIFDGAYSAEGVRSAVMSLELPRKSSDAKTKADCSQSEIKNAEPSKRTGDARVYADADFNCALLDAIKKYLNGGEGVIWMITNNKNAPGNDPKIEENTQKFYAELRDSVAITRIVAYPVRMAVKGPKFEAGGLLIYGIGYGETGGQALDAILAAGNPIHSLFEFPQIGLKPVKEAPVTLRFEDIKTEDGVRVSVQDGTLAVTGASAEKGAALRVEGRLHNTFYPQRIASAEIDLVWTEIGAAGTGLARASVTPQTVQNVPALADSEPFAVELGIPPIPRPPGLSGLVANARTVDGSLAIRLKNLRLDLDPEFLKRIEPIFAGAMMTGGQARTIDSQLPDIFFDFQRISETATTLPVRIEAGYSPWPLIGTGVAVLAMLVAAVIGAVLATAARTQKVMLGHHGKQIRLKPFRSETVRSPDGSQWRVRRGLFGPPSATRLGGPTQT